MPLRTAAANEAGKGVFVGITISLTEDRWLKGHRKHGKSDYARVLKIVVANDIMCLTFDVATEGRPIRWTSPH